MLNVQAPLFRNVRVREARATHDPLCVKFRLFDPHVPFYVRTYVSRIVLFLSVVLFPSPRPSSKESGAFAAENYERSKAYTSFLPILFWREREKKKKLLASARSGRPLAGFLHLGTYTHNFDYNARPNCKEKRDTVQRNEKGEGTFAGLEEGRTLRRRRCRPLDP